ncbi:unnamed protein product [Symbiodinium natans]|uniref:Uncharacterized protein n=1 Tax=Symbiodinium natans TaxID=878477 RepID=A0A812R5I8_9DINO|nr:unnamed protein product [Symbiodinium natans]
MELRCAAGPQVFPGFAMGEPDFFGNDPRCPGHAPWCRVKAVLSGLDGLLAAEREAGIRPGRVKLATTWSFNNTDSIDGKCKKCPGYFGFQDMLAAVADPSIAKYVPHTPAKDLSAAFDKRWINGLNVQAPWGSSAYEGSIMIREHRIWLCCIRNIAR